MANNVQAPLASAEASPVENQDGALLSPLILHYSTIAYALVIGAYAFAFGEYLYFRLTSLIFPEKVIYHSMCERRSAEIVGKNALHYATIIVAFCFVALFQIIVGFLFIYLKDLHLFTPSENVIKYHRNSVCFFGLTISEKWINCTLPESDRMAQKRHALATRIRSTMNATCFFGLTISEKWINCTLPESDRMAQKRHALATRIRSTMNATVYPTFICYIISSVIVWGVIFYMIGVRDSIDEIASSISLYIFDVAVLIYFLAFPTIVYIYHPFVRKSAALRVAHMRDAASHSGGSAVQELRAERTVALAADGSPPLASAEISFSSMRRGFACPISDSLTPLSACSDKCSSPQQHFHRNVRHTTTV
uniref:G protein-coupled receptor n=1 Tax=Ascaris lumbricoides TaxID=6252 RepID=A0A9J2PP10_ASCLU